jgi:hypothetical protein
LLFTKAGTEPLGLGNVDASSYHFSFLQARCFPIIVPFHSISLVFSNDVTVEQLALRRVGKIGLGAVADKIDVRIECRTISLRSAKQATSGGFVFAALCLLNSLC